GEEERRTRVASRDDVAAVVDEVEALAEVRRYGLEAGEPVDDTDDVGRPLQGLADLLGPAAHVGRVPAGVGADYKDARSRAQACWRADQQGAVEYQALPERVAQAPELRLVVEQLPGQAVERGADEQRPADLSEFLAQAGWDEGAVEDLSARLRFLGEACALGAPQQRFGAPQERAQRGVVERLAELLEDRLVQVALRN